MNAKNRLFSNALKKIETTEKPEKNSKMYSDSLWGGDSIS